MKNIGFICTLVFSINHCFADSRFINNTSDCTGNGKPKAYFGATVFSKDPENLSFANCGDWIAQRTDEKAPWHVILESPEKVNCKGLLVSEKTIITAHRCESVVSAFKEGRAVKVYGGPCETNAGHSNCIRIDAFDQGESFKLLRQRVLDVHSFELVGLPAHLHVWRIEGLNLSDGLKPVCLWNEDNARDEQLQFYMQDSFGYVGNLSGYSRNDECFTEPFPKILCRIYDRWICLNKSPDLWGWRFLLLRKGGRFYARGFEGYNGDKRVVWIDLLPDIKNIVSYSTDLAMMPHVPEVKVAHDFGANESFESCGSVNYNLQKAELPCYSNDSAIRGHDPWHASLTLHFGSGQIHCGATLISKRTLLTAAHCFIDERGVTLPPSKVGIQLGVYDFHNDAEESRQNFTSASILIHPGYNHGNGSKRHDLALVYLDENKVNVTDTVRPVCLWNEGYDFSKIANRIGKVVGRALTNGQNERYLQKIDLRLVPYDECFASNRSFYAEHMYPTENFCAKDNGLSIQEGGTGLILYSSKIRRYFLRGVLIERIGGVDSSRGNYSLFTDVTNYMKWIEDNAHI